MSVWAASAVSHKQRTSPTIPWNKFTEWGTMSSSSHGTPLEVRFGANTVLLFRSIDLFITICGAISYVFPIIPAMWFRLQLYHASSGSYLCALGDYTRWVSTSMVIKMSVGSIDLSPNCQRVFSTYVLIFPFLMEMVQGNRIRCGPIQNVCFACFCFFDFFIYSATSAVWFSQYSHHPSSGFYGKSCRWLYPPANSWLGL